jgi:uncharacterized protein (TIGR03382 family)
VRNRLLIALLGALAVIATAERRADACSCEPIEDIVPADGAVDVPLNAVIMVQRWGVARADRIDVVETGTNAVVASATPETTGSVNITTLAPSAPLAANTTYEVVAFPASAFPAPLSTFTTGSETDTTAPVFAGLESVVAESMDVRECTLNSCVSATSFGWFPRLRLGFTAPSDIAYYALETRNQQNQDVTRQLVFASSGAFTDPSNVTGIGCELVKPPTMHPGDSFCARLIAYDQAGNTAGAEVELCAPVAECAASCDDDNGVPNDECPAPPEPLDPTVIDPPLAPKQGGCSSQGLPAAGWLAAMAALLLLVVRRRAR